MCLTLTRCSWIIWRILMERDILTTCTGIFQARSALLSFFTFLSCTSEFDAKFALCPRQAIRRRQLWSFGRMSIVCPSPQLPPSGVLQTATGQNSCDLRTGAKHVDVCNPIGTNPVNQTRCRARLARRLSCYPAKLNALVCSMIS